jgi:TetR/AcrR family transcriptional regulator, transcriptional repressor for nem operon
MSYTPEHKRKTRQTILESARRLFNKRGFSEVSIEEVMENAGLTRGGFYRHFENKDDLYAETVRWFLCADAPKPWQRAAPPARPAIKPHGQRVVDSYFSRDHFDDRETCCPLIALPSDIMRGSDVVKRAYRDVLEKLLHIFEADMHGPRRRERALALVAMCVGGVIVARCVDDPALAEGLRRAAHQHAMRTGGWIKRSGDRARVKQNRQRGTVGASR